MARPTPYAKMFGSLVEPELDGLLFSCSLCARDASSLVEHELDIRA
jgi:hypothetical protein